MKSATRVLATITMGGAMAGGAVALWHVPAPPAAATAAVSGPGATDAAQQLADQSAQLHIAIASAQTQLAQLRAGAVAPSDSPDLAALLLQADNQLAVARQRLAVDEALLARLQAVGHARHPSVAAPTPAHTTPQVAPAVTPQAAPPETSSASPPVRQSAPSTPAAHSTAPTRQRTYSPSPQPTNRGGDD